MFQIAITSRKPDKRPAGLRDKTCSFKLKNTLYSLVAYSIFISFIIYLVVQKYELISISSVITIRLQFSMSLQIWCSKLLLPNIALKYIVKNYGFNWIQVQICFFKTFGLFERLFLLKLISSIFIYFFKGIFFLFPMT